MSKDKSNTRKGLAAGRRRAAEERKATAAPTPRREYRGEMEKMLKDIDPDRFERLADGREQS